VLTATPTEANPQIIAEAGANWSTIPSPKVLDSCSAPYAHEIHTNVAMTTKDAVLVLQPFDVIAWTTLNLWLVAVLLG